MGAAEPAFFFLLFFSWENIDYQQLTEVYGRSEEFTGGRASEALGAPRQCKTVIVIKFTATKFSCLQHKITTVILEHKNNH